jgi:RND family efflux transporter MFP subunit
VTKPEVKDLTVTTDYIGTIEADETVSVYPQTSGKVSAVHVQAGQTVAAGELLFEIDPADAVTAYEQAKLTYDQAQISYQSAGVSYDLTLNDIEQALDTTLSRESEELSYQSQLRQALNSYNNAKDKMDLERADISDYSRLKRAYNDVVKAWEKGDATLEDVWQAQEDLDDVRDWLSEESDMLTNLDEAYDNLELVRDKYANYLATRDKDDENSKITSALQRQKAELTYQSSLKSLQNAQLALRKAKKTLNDTKVTAPVAGVVETKAVEQYDAVNTNTEAYTITASANVSIAFNVSADGASALGIGDTVTVSKGTRTYSATVSEIDMRANSIGLFPVKAAIDGSGGSLLTGVSAKVTAATARSDGALVIPMDTISYDGPDPYVYVFKDGRAVKTVLVLGISNSAEAEVTKGLDVQDQVITTWHPDLADGVAVSLKG